MKINPDVMAVLDRAKIDGNKLFLGDEQLDRKLYQDVNKVLVSIGGKWNRSAKAHIFDGDVAEVLEPILDTGEYNRTKQDYGQFDSPDRVVARVIQLARIQPGDAVLEPSAGIGNIAFAAQQEGGTVIAIEIDTKRAAIANDILDNGCAVDDFLEEQPHEVLYDVIVMNPPFAKQADIHHVLHAAKFLRPGGRLVSVMSAGVMFRSNKLTKSFREYVADHGGEIELLPDGSFSSSGTEVHACIVSFRSKFEASA